MGTLNGGERARLPPSGYELCQKKKVLALLATGFGPRMPQIARAQPVSCQPTGVKQPRLYKQENDGNIGKVMSNLDKHRCSCPRAKRNERIFCAPSRILPQRKK
jgi:hypothetical protein